MGILARSLVGACFFAVACSPAATPPTTPASSPAVPPTPVAPTASTAPAPAASAGDYSGHGASSVSPEVLAKFAAPPLDPAVARRIQAMLDVRSADRGLVSPGGKHLF